MIEKKERKETRVLLSMFSGVVLTQSLVTNRRHSKCDQKCEDVFSRSSKNQEQKHSRRWSFTKGCAVLRFYDLAVAFRLGYNAYSTILLYLGNIKHSQVNIRASAFQKGVMNKQFLISSRVNKNQFFREKTVIPPLTLRYAKNKMKSNTNETKHIRAMSVKLDAKQIGPCGFQ